MLNRAIPLISPGSLPGMVSRLGLVLVLALISGCGSSTGTVSGKVATGGKSVDGTVQFYAQFAEKAQRDAPIGQDGVYTIKDLKPGQYKIAVKGFPVVDVPKGVPKGIDKLPVEEKKIEKTGVAPPKKYESPDNGLALEVKAGSQTFDITLTP